MCRAASSSLISRRWLRVTSRISALKRCCSGVAIPVRFVGAHRVLVPFAGENALPVDGFKAVANAADTGEQIDKAECIIRMVSRGRGSSDARCASSRWPKTASRPGHRGDALEYCRAPVLFPDGNQLRHQRFHIIYCHQLAQITPARLPRPALPAETGDFP
ncbi:Uncharacterised protein [Raoultella terrigena]|uniref:Uncharacterized protein n=1 Tax=Raoultella terrigena TaxID=577 RepID=A0A3P8KIU8_RAOTE|nr:Uncharacterised protein [Raoultella terrigena]